MPPLIRLLRPHQWAKNALAFIGLRLLYGVFYIGDWHALRSLAWALAMACVVGMFVAAA